MIRIRKFIFTPLIVLVTMSCEQHAKIKVENVTIVETEDDVDPPPPELTSKFKTLQDWLDNICDSSKPKKSIEKFKFGLFGSSTNDYVLFLVGTNTYKEGEHRSATHIEFEPTHNYLQIPKNEYKNLTQKQFEEKLTSQLKEFTKTSKFQNSFLAKANSIVYEPNGEVIWKKGS
jgi:hypothetical protein